MKPRFEPERKGEAMVLGRYCNKVRLLWCFLFSFIHSFCFSQSPTVEWEKVFDCSGERVLASYVEIVSESSTQDSAEPRMLYIRSWRSGTDGLLEYSKNKPGNADTERTSRIICNRDYAAAVVPLENGWKMSSFYMNPLEGWMNETRLHLFPDQMFFNSCFANWIKDSKLESSNTIQSSGKVVRQLIFVRDGKPSSEMVPSKIQFDLDGQRDLLIAYTADLSFEDGDAVCRGEVEWDMNGSQPRIAKFVFTWSVDGVVAQKRVLSYSYPKDPGFDRSQCKLEHYGLTAPTAATTVPIGRYLFYFGILLLIVGFVFRWLQLRRGRTDIQRQ